MSSPIDLTAEDSDVEVTGPPVIDLTKDTKPVRRKRPRDTVRSKGTPIEGDRRPRKKHDVRGVTDKARRRRAPVDDQRTKLKRDADSAFKRRAFDEAGSMFVNLAALHEEAEDFEGAGRELGNAAACALNTGKELAADRLCTDALKLAPDNASVLLRRARCRRVMGKDAAAKRDAQAAFTKATPLDKSRTSFMRDLQAFGIDTQPKDPWASIRVARLNASKPCTVLGVSVQRDGEEITPQAARAAFRKCAVRYHPDKLQQNNITGQQAEAAKEKFRECREAADLFADASRSRQFHYNYAVIGTRLPDNISEEVLGYDSDRDAHRIRDRASWLESTRRLRVQALGGAAPAPPAARRRR